MEAIKYIRLVMGDKPKPPATTRYRVILSFIECLSHEKSIYVSQDPRMICALAEEIEAGILDVTKEVGVEYCNIALNIYTQLHPDRTLSLQTMIGTNALNPRHAAKLKVIEMDPEPTKDTQEFIKKQKNVKIEQHYSTLYKCKYCGSDKVVERENQTRSSDEAKTYYLDCQSCNRSFRS